MDEHADVHKMYYIHQYRIDSRSETHSPCMNSEHIPQPKSLLTDMAVRETDKESHCGSDEWDY